MAADALASSTHVFECTGFPKFLAPFPLQWLCFAFLMSLVHVTETSWGHITRRGDGCVSAVFRVTAWQLVMQRNFFVVFQLDLLYCSWCFSGALPQVVWRAAWAARWLLSDGAGPAAQGGGERAGAVGCLCGSKEKLLLGSLLSLVSME